MQRHPLMIVQIGLLCMLLTEACSASRPRGKVSQRADGEQNAGDASGNPANPADAAPANNAPVSGDTTSPVEVLKSFSSPFALRSFDQVSATMASLTGVKALPAIAITPITLDALNTSLPGERQITEFQGGTQFATYKLASEYCSAMVDGEVTQPRILSGIRLSALPSEALSNTGKVAVVRALTEKFWILPPNDLPQMQRLLTDLIDELMAGKSLSTAAQTVAIVKATCTAVLASAPVTFY